MANSHHNAEEIKDLLTFVDEYAVFTPEGYWELTVGIETVTRAITFCRRAGIHGLIVDVRWVIGMQSPTVAEKFWYTRDWAAASRQSVAVAIVAKAEIIDPEKIGVTMAANAGLRSDVFDDMDDAVRWMEERLSSRRQL